MEDIMVGDQREKLASPSLAFHRCHIAQIRSVIGLFGILCGSGHLVRSYGDQISVSTARMLFHISSKSPLDSCPVSRRPPRLVQELYMITETTKHSPNLDCLMSRGVVIKDRDSKKQHDIEQGPYMATSWLRTS
ncbi:hypothetical protein BU16DRAFT_557422 [Lophium mytilinum]|uniref:Uncharacterized protein n=1 Tax=Lophium mytilinum TaxID=390894 RepID=A0A6A6R2X8_9PEZI|nr:hypothetical protein BU16DRAFT_557422 [Lophium mytilinum]